MSKTEVPKNARIGIKVSRAGGLYLQNGKTLTVKG